LQATNIGACDILPGGWAFYRAGWNDPQGTYRSKSKGPPPGSKSSGVIALANAIPDMEALSKLDISRNFIGAVQEGELQRICLASGIGIELAQQATHEVQETHEVHRYRCPY
jgi:hypothetical protein